MNFEQETTRLIMRVLTPDEADKALTFYKNNAPIFEKYEPIISDNFYSLEHQRHLLAHEFEETLKLHMVRFWLFKKEDPSTIIGTISFHGITPDIFASTQVGYKIDPKFWRQGYCYEALVCGIRLLSKEIGIRRFEALVLPTNTPSISLLEKLGFQQEGLLKDKVYLQEKWRDHYLYGLIIK